MSRLRGGLEEVSIVAFAPKPAPPGAGYVGLDCWRIKFERVRAFRYRPITGWPTTAFARPAGSDAGAWEVSPSRWMTEELPPILRESMHHYVITYNDDAYELIAAGWSSEPLPEGWREELRADLDGS